MLLKAKIQENLKRGLKGKDELAVSVLRLLLAAILNKEKEKRYKLAKTSELKEEELVKESELTDEEILEVISSEIKKRKEAILEFEKGKRQDLVKKEKAEAEILQRYLPEQLSQPEIEKLAKEVIAALRASLSPRSTQGEAGAPSEREKIGMKDMGGVMKELMPKVKGKADGDLVSKIVKELLSQT